MAIVICDVPLLVLIFIADELSHWQAPVKINPGTAFKGAKVFINQM
jgi:hypothetical protein